jgi:hypothetical protein
VSAPAAAAGDTWARRRAAAVTEAALAAIADPSLAEPERRRAKQELAGDALSDDRRRWDAALAALTPAELETVRSVLRRLVPQVGGAAAAHPFEREAARRRAVAALDGPVEP